MAPEKAPAFQFWPKDFLTSEEQAVLSLEQAGAYIRLLCVCWLEQTIPDNADRAARLIGCHSAKQMERIWPAVRACFEVDAEQSGRLRHGRLDREREVQAEWRRKSAEGGRKAQANRKGASTTLATVVQPNTNSPSPVSILHSPSTPQPPAPSALDVRFASFWNAYPKKVGKGDALKAWHKIRPSDTLADTIIAAVEQQKQSAQWQKDGGQYIPNPATWLNQGRWDDELPIGEPTTALSAARSSNRTQGNIAAMEAFIARHSQKALPQ